MATQNYEVTVNPNAITLDLTTQNNILTVQTVDYVMSLSRTGGQGAQGYSAYEIAVQNGYTGTAQEFSDELASIAEKSALAVASAAAAATSATSATNSATASAASASNSSISAGAASASANAAAQSAVTAAAQANASSQSATNSAASALESSNYADASEDSAIDSELSAADAAASEDAAASSEANALLYRNEAQTAATSAGTSSTNANAQALAASLSAASAATSATNADNSEDNAASSATSALNSATSANTSANQAAISATTATTQATSATNSATAAAASQADALVSKNSASASASTATTKASEASNSAATASTKATEASASAAQAVLSATSASTSASTATLKAAEAAQSAADAAAAQAAAEASLASFRSTYLGELNADPTLDGNGDPVMIGAEYFNSVANKLKVYTSTGWQFYDATAQTASQNAALSASQAASSAATSQSYATTAINKAAEAATSANAADASADAALASENAAESSEINASASENYALNYKNAAATSADLASSYASASGVSATNAATSATTATTQATNSANSATASATSATNSANSALASANSATNAANSAASAATSANDAGVSEANADTSEANALASANTATTKAAEASTSATNAATSATNSAASATSSALSEGLATTAAATATTKASEASVSATSASGSATTATTKAAEATTAATSANTSATNAATSATNAANSASSATTSSASASTSATLAGNSANAAALSETNAATSASAANTYASNAATSASSADTSESNAEIYADNALASSIAAANTVTTVTGYANTASTKADEASASATSAANSATSATASANIATTQATNASNSATAASTSASNASASATTATTQASNAASSATSASTSASAANISAINADTSATNAASSANTANVAKAAAEAARDQALAAFDNFDDKYLGEKASNPTLDNDGNPLVVGALYFNTTLQGMRVYTGTAWVAAYMSGDGYLLASNNLSELTNVVTARANLGLGTSALANGYSLDGLTDVTISSATNGQILEYESATNLWKNKTINALPAQATHNGQFLTTDGTNASWATVDALPPQATHADKFLRTDGTAAYWATVNLPTSAYTRTSFTATAGQTTFNVTYPLGSIQVYVNGVLLRTSDYTATNETSFTLNVPASAGAAVDAFVYNVYGVGQVLAENIIGTVAIGSGGTGATTASGARTNLGLGTAATTDSTAYATATQGAKADTALQPATIGVSVQGYNANTVIDSAYVHTDNNYTTTEKSKLAGIAAGAEVNVNADWTSSSGDSQILNKPTLGTASAQDVGYFATAAQGTLADNAVSAITSSDGSVIISPTGTIRDLSVGTAASTGNLISQVRNETGGVLTKGTVVYISGAAGNKAVVSKAIATGDSTSAQTYGMVQADIPNNQNGYVVVVGSVSGLNTIAYPDGTQLYLSGTTAGGYTNTKPYAPIHLVYVGVVTYSHANQGTIQVKIQNGYEMDEIHDVSAQNPTNGDTLVYVSSTGLWTKTPQSTLSVASAAAVPFSGVTGKPTTLSGYGITDAYSSSNPSGYISGITSSNVTTALGYTPENAANKGNANGYASLDGSGLVPASQLPSYVDDVLEYTNLASFPGTGATGKIYVALDTNKTYRWSGSAYIYITSGAVDSVAGRTGVVTLNSSDVGLGSVENKSSATIRNEITSSNVTNALGFTPYNSTNPSGYISGITSSNVTTALGFTPYNATNPSGYITSAALSSYLPLSGGTLTGQLIIGATGTANSPTLRLNTSSSGAFVHSQENLAANLTTGQHIISVIGKTGNTKNSGYIGYTWAGDASNSNFVTIGHWGADDLLRVYGDGNVTVGSNTVLHAGNYNSYALPLGGGTVTGQTYISTSGYPLQLISTQRYALQVRNTNNNVNSGYGWWLAHDANSNFALHADGIGDILTVGRNGSFTVNGNTVLNAGNYTSYSPSLTGSGASGTWGINISGNASNASSANGAYQLSTDTTSKASALQYWQAYDRSDINPNNNWHYALRMSHGDAETYYSGTIALDFGSDILSFRRKTNGVNASWRTILHDGNYSSYALPLSGGTMTGHIVHVRGSHNYFERSSGVAVGGMGWHTNDSFYVAGHPGYGPGAGNDVRVYGFGNSLHLGNSTYGDVLTIANGYTQGTGSVRAPIFYDSNDTAFYLDPNGTSVLNVLSNAALSDSKLYLRTRGDNNHYLWNAEDDWEELVAYAGTGFRVGNSNGTTASLTCYGNANGNYVQAAGSMRAPIFYDSENTGYYVDPTSSSTSFYMNGGMVTTAPGGAILMRHAVSEVDAWLFMENATNWGLYWKNNPSGNHVLGGYTTVGAELFGMSAVNSSGNGVATTNFVGATSAVAQWMMSNYTGYIWSASTIFAAGDMRAPIFYDSNNTAYYVDPNSTGTSMNAAGNVTIGNGSANTGLFINYGGGAGDYAVVGRCYQAGTNNQTIHVFSTAWQGGTLQSTSAGSINLDGANGTTIGAWNNNDMWIDKSGNSQSRTSSRAPIFYDSNNTAYYSDPNGTSIFNSLLVGTTTRWNNEIFNVMRSTDGTVNTVPAVARLMNSGSGRITKLLFTDNAIIDGIMCMVPVSASNSYFSLGFSGYTEQGFQVYSDGRTQSSASSRAPIFYDSNDTAYYADPASSGKSMLFNGNIECTARSESWAEGIRVNCPGPGNWGGLRFTRSGSTSNWAIGYTGLNSTDDLTFYSGTYSAIRLNLDHSGNLTASGNITAYSDERLKTDWKAIEPNFVEKLSKVKSGTYTRIEDNQKQAGSSAQDWQKLLPEVVSEAEDDLKTLSLAYGNAALVSAVELAKEVVDLKSKLNQQQSELDELKSLVKSLLANR